jgi:serine phosphatase RsbU (regulator of sigma subunit)/anti-sigma regulatory factor (Ser/Thr protein kinase)
MSAMATHELGGVEHHSEWVPEIFEGSSCFHYAFRGDELRIVAANRAGRELMLDRPILGLTPSDVPDTGLEEVRTILRSVQQTGRSVHDPALRVKIDGTDGASERWLDLTVSPWLDAEGRQVGVLSSGFDVTDHVLATAHAAEGEAEAHERYARARQVVLRLQGVLLPTTVPLLPRVDVAAAYLVAGLEQAAGGDWFDAATVPDGRLALTVGDVVGHGVEASAVMAQLRAVLAARLFEGSDLVTSVGAVEAYAERVSGAFATTVCVALLDPSTGDLEYVTRGHPAPLVVNGTSARLLAATGDGPLGARAIGRVGTDRLAPDEAVLLFTDGLVEKRDRPVVDGVAALERSAVAALRGTPHGGGMLASAAVRISQRVPRDLVDDGFTDDVTLLVAVRRTPPPPLHLTVPAEPTRLAQLRHAIEEWCAGVGLGRLDRNHLVLGVSEIAANAVEHAYRDRDPRQPPGTMTMDASIGDDAVIRVVVTDQGRWRDPDPRPGERGRGFSMLATAGLQIAVDPGPAGTAVTLESPARRPASVDEAGPVREAVVSRTGPVTLSLDAERSRLLVGGAVDHLAAATRLDAEVRRLARNGLVPVELDLRDVEYLGSAGVRVLESLADEFDELAIIAPTGSPAAQTLGLAGTPHVLTGP